jgi:hypothetical protein
MFSSTYSSAVAAGQDLFELGACDSTEWKMFFPFFCPTSALLTSHPKCILEVAENKTNLVRCRVGFPGYGMRLRAGRAWTAGSPTNVPRGRKNFHPSSWHALKAWSATSLQSSAEGQLFRDFDRQVARITPRKRSLAILKPGIRKQFRARPW